MELIKNQSKLAVMDISPNLYSIENMYKRKMVERAKIVIVFGVDPLISEQDRTGAKSPSKS